MNRRDLLASVGILGTSGCLRLRGDATSTPETETGTAEPAATDASDDAGGDGLADAERLTLSERWAADVGVRYVLTDGGHFFFNGLNVAGEAVPGDGVLWTAEVAYEGSTGNLGADAIARGDGVAVYGFFSERGTVENPGAHFVAHEDVSGEEVWSMTVPATEADGFTMLPRGAIVVDGVAVLGLNPPNRGKYLVYGVDVTTGEELWTAERDGFLNYLDAYGDEAYLGLASGVARVDPNTGSENGREESWRGSPGRIHGNSLFAASRSTVDAHPVADGGVEWSTAGLGEVVALVVDNSLVVAGTESGGIHAVDRATGEPSWEASIGGTVWQMELTPEHVWVADRETGLTAYDRDDGRNVHRSTQPIERSDIGVVSETILFGMDTARAYDIEAE